MLICWLVMYKGLIQATAAEAILLTGSIFKLTQELCS
jgi:hypothetical protein